MYLNAECFNLAAQHGAAAIVELNAHQSRGELNNMGFQAEVFYCVGTFQSEQSATHNHTDFAVFGLGLNHAEIVNRAIDQAGFKVVAFYWRYKRIGACRQYQFVIGILFATLGGDDFIIAINARYKVAKVCFNAKLTVVISGGHCEIFWSASREDFGEVNPVIGWASFTTNNGDMSLYF